MELSVISLNLVTCINKQSNHQLTSSKMHKNLFLHHSIVGVCFFDESQNIKRHDRELNLVYC